MVNLAVEQLQLFQAFAEFGVGRVDQVEEAFRRNGVAREIQRAQKVELGVLSQHQAFTGGQERRGETELQNGHLIVLKSLQNDVHIRNEKRKPVNPEQLHLLRVIFNEDLNFLRQLVEVGIVLLLLYLPLIFESAPLHLFFSLLARHSRIILVFSKKIVAGANDVTVQNLVDVHFLRGIHLLQMPLSSESGPGKIFFLPSIFLVDVEVLSAVLVEIFTIQAEKLLVLRHQLRF